MRDENWSKKDVGDFSNEDRRWLVYAHMCLFPIAHPPPNCTQSTFFAGRLNALIYSRLKSDTKTKKIDLSIFFKKK